MKPNISLSVRRAITCMQADYHVTKMVTTILLVAPSRTFKKQNAAPGGAAFCNSHMRTSAQASTPYFLNQAWSLFQPSFAASSR